MKPAASKEKLTVCILQPPLRAPDQTPLEYTKIVIKLMEEAWGDDLDLMLLPELCPVGYSEDTFAAYLPCTPQVKAMYRNIDQELQNAAKTMNTAICYGTIGWKQNTGAIGSYSLQYFIRQNVVDASGTLLASYDKIHLCNYGDCAETRFFTPGQETVSFSIHGWKFGLMICADMRYPILSQSLVKDHGADALLQPACFARDISFRTWKSFRETRAVENSVYFLASNYAGNNFGESSLVPPWVDENHEPEVLGTDVGYLIRELDRTFLMDARTQLPFYKHLCESSCCER